MSRIATKVAQLSHASGYLSFSTFLSTFARAQQAKRAISVALKAVQTARSCAHWQRRNRSGASRRGCPAVGFLLRYLGSLVCLILSAQPRKGLLLLAPETKNNASVPKRRCRDFGASGVAAYIVATWLAAGGKSGKREVCRGRELVQN